MKSILPLYLTCIFLLLFSCSSFGKQVENHIEICNAAYHNGRFEQAIACYEAIDPNRFSSSILYNIGNSYAQLGQTGKAVLYYQRALCLSPGDSDISGNLALIRNNEGLFFPEPSVVEKTASLLSITQWSLLILAAFTSYLIFAVFHLKKPQKRPFEILVVTGCLLLIMIGGTGAAIQYSSWLNSVVISDTTLLLSPFEKAQPSGSIKQGRMVIPHKQHGGYSYITDETGRKGWISDTAIVPVLPFFDE